MGLFSRDRSPEDAIKELKHYLASNLIGRLQKYRSLVNLFRSKHDVGKYLQDSVTEEQILLKRIIEFTNVMNKHIENKTITRDIFDHGGSLQDYPQLLYMFFSHRLIFYQKLLDYVEKNPAHLGKTKEIIRPIYQEDQMFKTEARLFLRVIRADHALQDRMLIPQVSIIIEKIMKKEGQSGYTRPAIHIR